MIAPTSRFLDCLPSWSRRIGAAALIVALLPIALAASAWHAIKGGADTSPGELAKMLREVAEDGDNSEYWDELENVNLRNAELEAIRQEALRVVLTSTEARSQFILLAKRAEAARELN